MIDAILNDPEKVGIISLLLAAVITLMRGAVIPGVTHDRIVKSQAEAHAKELSQLRESEQIWKQLAFRAINLTEVSATSLEVVTKKQIVERQGGDG